MLSLALFLSALFGVSVLLGCGQAVDKAVFRLWLKAKLLHKFSKRCNLIPYSQALMQIFYQAYTQLFHFILPRFVSVIFSFYPQYTGPIITITNYI